MARRPNTRPTSIYWLIDTRPETLAEGWQSGLPFYCGKTVHSLKLRLSQHQYEASVGNRAVHRRVRECGEHIRIHLWETVPCDRDWVVREKAGVALLRGSFPNTCNTADGGAGVPGRIASAETRAKIVKANTGRKHSAETCAKITAFLTGRKRSAESVERGRAKMLGRVNSPEHRAKISASKKGKPGKPLTAEHREKIRAGNKGKKRTPEQCETYRQSQIKAHLERVKARGICPSFLLALPC